MCLSEFSRDRCSQRKRTNFQETRFLQLHFKKCHSQKLLLLLSQVVAFWKHGWEQDDGRDKKAKDIEKAERTSRNKFMSLPREGGNQTSSELFSIMSPTAIVSSTDEFQKDASCCLLVDKSSSDNATEDDICAERNRVSNDGTEVGVALPYFITETFHSLHLLHLIDL